MSGPMKKMMLSALLLSILTPVSFASSKAENEIRITYGAIFNQAALIDYCRNYPIKEWLKVGFGFGHVVIDPGKKRCSPIFEASANSQRQDYHHVQSCIGVLSQL